MTGGKTMSGAYKIVKWQNSTQFVTSWLRCLIHRISAHQSVNA